MNSITENVTNHNTQPTITGQRPDTNRSQSMSVRDMLLYYIVEFIREHGYSPTHRELLFAFPMPTSTMKWHLRMLEKHGKITRRDDKARNIEIIVQPSIEP
jgi:SOS-response transcriptional repressor LexA